MAGKLYCVCVHERPYVYTIEADSPRDAEDRIIATEWAGNYDDIARVEVTRECACGNEIDVNATLCKECGEPL